MKIKPGFHRLNAQTVLSDRIKPVFNGTGSTALSVYDTNPESPDGKYLCFIRFPETTDQGNPVEPAEVMIRNNVTGKTEKIYDIRVSKHSGANAIWVNDSIIAFKVDHLNGFFVYDIYNKHSLFGLIDGELGHKSFDNIIDYSICNYRSRNFVITGKPFKPGEEGIYSFNVLPGEKKQVISKDEIIEIFVYQNSNITGNGTLEKADIMDLKKMVSPACICTAGEIRCLWCYSMNGEITG